MNRDSDEIVYSTDPQFHEDRSKDEEVETLPPAEQKLSLAIERHRGPGKPMTAVSGFVGADEDIKALAKTLKQKLGCGGSVKSKVILLQGDKTDELSSLLRALGYGLL